LNDGYPMDHILTFLQGGVLYVGVFLVVLTVLVFVHELGHYLIARYNGVRIEVFSIGFGPELFGWWDRSGTRWKFSTIPLGGYVKMYGDSDATSGLPVANIGRLTVEEREMSFHCKRLGQRAAIVAGGPLANFAFAIVALALLFMTYGQPFTPAEVGQVLPGSAAAAGDIRPGDTIVSIDGSGVERFEDVQQVVRLNPNVPMAMVVKRDGETITLKVTPTLVEENDKLGRHQIGQLGIRGGGAKYIQRDPISAVGRAVGETWNLSVTTLQAMWQMITGARGTEELGGPLRIAQLSGEVAKGGLMPLLWFMAVLSVNLGLINLFPVPVLDGGHLLFYAAEAIRGRPLGQRVQEYGFRIGLALVLTLMVFATWNDRTVLYGLADFLKRFVT
jgi:regulator of sigma E protease